MSKLLLSLLAATCFSCAIAQNTTPNNKASDYKPQFGLKAGYNWSYITGTSQGFNNDTKTGFMLGAFYAPPSKGFGFRSELIFSRQGYTYDNGGSNTDVLNDYLYLPQLSTFTIGKRFQIQAGGQIGFLLNAKKTTDSKDTSIVGLMNKFDYGFVGGVDIYPINALIIGARYNLGLGKLYKEDYSSPNPYPLPFNPETTNFKNGVFQLFVGVKF